MATADDFPWLHDPNMNWLDRWDEIERNVHNKRYILEIRQMAEEDISSECPFPPTQSEYFDDVDILCNDISTVFSGQVTWNKNNRISFSSRLPIIEVKENLRPLLSNVFCSIRFVSISCID